MMIVLVAVVIIILAIIITISMHYVVTSKKPEDEKIKYIRQLTETLELCKIESGDGNVSDRISTIIETLKYGDVNGLESSQNVEIKIMEKASELFENLKSRKSGDVNNNIEELLRLIKEKEVIIKNSK